MTPFQRQEVSNKDLFRCNLGHLLAEYIDILSPAEIIEVIEEKGAIVKQIEKEGFKKSSENA